jgi:hypothetical protein
LARAFRVNGRTGLSPIRAGGSHSSSFFKQTKPGRVWGCDGVGYDIQKLIGMVRINKSGVEAHSFQKGIAACA